MTKFVCGGCERGIAWLDGARSNCEEGEQKKRPNPLKKIGNGMKKLVAAVSTLQKPKAANKKKNMMQVALTF